MENSGKTHENMNQLQKEILQAIADNSATYPDPEAVKAAAEVCLRWIQKAQIYAASAGAAYGNDGAKSLHLKFLKDNGLTE